MVRTFEETSNDDKLDNVLSFEDNLLLAITGGDYLRARRRRFPKGLICSNVEFDEISSDGFAAEIDIDTDERFKDGFADEINQQSMTTSLYRYSHLETIYTFYIWDGHFEYLE